MSHGAGRIYLDATRTDISAAATTTTPHQSRRRSRTDQTAAKPQNNNFSWRSPLAPDSSWTASEPMLASRTTALTLARQAPIAGYLNKLGTTVRHFKRRFFVLQPTTTLYYFLSPDDEEPRGCLDLEGATITPRFLKNSVYQFVIQLAAPNNDDPFHGSQQQQQPPPQQVILEARSEEDAKHWIHVLQTERIDVVQEQYKKAQLQLSGYRSRIRELEQTVDNFKLVEADRDGALEDAAQWKAQFEQLDDSIRRYAQELRRHNDEDDMQTTTAVGDIAEKQGDEDDETLSPIDPAGIPGRHFTTLFHTVEQIKENLQLASDEAATAVEDVKRANATVQTLEKRMAQAETHLCKIWEENCELRKLIKQIKREKRVLVKEVKNLREHQQRQKARQKGTDTSDAAYGEEEEQKLLADIEAHIQTSIQLHKELVGGKDQSDDLVKPDLNVSMGSDDSGGGIVGATLRLSSCVGAPCNTAKPTLTPIPQTKNVHMASLLDNDEEEDDDDDGEEDSGSCSSLNSRKAASQDSSRRDLLEKELRIDIDVSESADGDYSQRTNPIGKLDDIDLNDGPPPKLIAVSGSSTIHTKQPTSQLSCPLADVVSSTSDDFTCADGEIYHVTFYSRKIGLQFQKVPPPPTQAKGLLTEAMTADLAKIASASEKTAAELRRIAKISGTAKTERMRDMSCPVAKPIDAVLVCGFVGFDDSIGNKRPKLGARLVAFDGVSLEAGAWTFQSVRKAIQARRRPLTLSFRNDFLTTVQRKILTKAVKDMENLSPSVGDGPFAANDRPEPASTRSSVSQRSSQYDEMSTATGSSVGLGHNSESSASSFSKFRSFSEAGSSISVLSAVGPLVSNLLGQRREPFTPEYLRRPSVPIDESPHHLDFKSELL